MKKIPDDLIRILVVEDDVETAAAIARLLKILGADALAVHDGESAVRQFTMFKPSLMIVDIGLPDITGWDVARMVRAHPDSVQPYLVALSGWGQSKDIKKSLAAGFDEHLVKPVELKQIKQLLLIHQPT